MYKTVALSTIQPRCAHNIEARHQMFDVHLPRSLGRSVYSLRAGSVELGVGAAFAAVEHHVSADVNKWDSRPLTRDGDIASAQGVDIVSSFRFALRAVHVG